MRPLRSLLSSAMFIPARFTPKAEASAAHKNILQCLAPSLLRGDRLADEAVESMAELAPGVGSAMLDRALAEGIDAVPDMPPGVQRLIQQMESIPDWLDWERINDVGKAFLRTGQFRFLTLACYALPLAYASPDANKPLALSGQLLERAPRRLTDTSVAAVCVQAVTPSRRDAIASLRPLLPSRAGFLVPTRERHCRNTDSSSSWR